MFTVNIPRVITINLEVAQGGAAPSYKLVLSPHELVRCITFFNHSEIGVTIWLFNSLPWKITIFNGKIHYKWAIYTMAM